MSNNWQLQDKILPLPWQGGLTQPQSIHPSSNRLIVSCQVATCLWGKVFTPIMYSIDQWWQIAGVLATTHSFTVAIARGFTKNGALLKPFSSANLVTQEGGGGCWLIEEVFSHEKSIMSYHFKHLIFSCVFFYQLFGTLNMWNICKLIYCMIRSGWFCLEPVLKLFW